MAKQYCAVIGDLIQSRKISRRSQIQKDLAECLANQNIKHRAMMVSPLTITLGDEFQGLWSDADGLFRSIAEIRSAMHPLPIRFAIGLGEILTEINPELSIGADGPAYWQARAMITELKSSRDYGITQTGAASQNASPILAVVNDTLALCDLVMSKWRPTQWQVYQAMATMEYTPHLDQNTLARSLQITPSSLQKRLKSSGIKVIQRSYRNVAETINTIIQEGN